MSIDGNEINPTVLTPTSLTPLLTLLQSPITEIVMTKNGHLAVTFVSGAKIYVAPDDQVEGWQVGSLVGAKDCLFVCAPGGEVALFM